jgi:2',3'-cyclic-nucleotide 2'-phosphodiesterase (5'-nucleotidase family)
MEMLMIKLATFIRVTVLPAAALLCLIAPETFAQAAKPAPALPAYKTHTSQQQIDSSVGEDKEVLELLAPYEATIREKMSVVIGHAPETINKDGVAAGRLGLLVTDIIRQQAATKSKRPVDLAVQNNGGLRAEIPAGDITVGTIFRLMPFENELVVVEMSGQDLLELFQSMGANIQDFGAAISGGQIVFDQQGNVVSASIGDKPLDVKATYTVALTDYLYSGGGEYPILQRGKNSQVLGLLLRDAIMNYIRELQQAGHKLTAPVEKRIRVESAANSAPHK